MKTRRIVGCAVVIFSLQVGGCGRAEGTVGVKSEHAEKEAHQAHEEGEGHGVSFHPGEGLELSAEVAAALGITTATAEERKLDQCLRGLAQVFVRAPQVLASLVLPEADAARWEGAQVERAKLLRVDRSRLRVSRQVELIFSLEKESAAAVGEFVELTGRRTTPQSTVIPESAVLEAAQGVFVYVVKGQHYSRVPVEIGGHADGFVAIAEGLEVGEVVVSAPVEQLWLTELRLTKGGGHSH